MSANAITVKDVTKVYRLYDKPIDRLKESLSLTHKSYHKDFYALNGLSFNVEKDRRWALSERTVPVINDLKDHHRCPHTDHRPGGR